MMKLLFGKYKQAWAISENNWMRWLFYILTSAWVLCTPNTGPTRLFQHFFTQKSRK